MLAFAQHAGEQAQRDAIQHLRERYPNSEVPRDSQGAWEQHEARAEVPIYRKCPGCALTAAA